MKKIERIRLMREVAGLLAEREWHEIDFLLKEFGGYTEDYWSGERGAYTLQGVPPIEDSDLLDLAALLRGGDGGDPDLSTDGQSVGPRAEPVAGGPWREGMFRLFLSHTHRHAPLVAEVKDDLAQYGIDGFVAHRDIRPTKRWEGEIESALRTSDALAALLTEDFHESDWTDHEVGWSVGRPVLVIGVRLGCPPYGFIGKWQALNGPWDGLGARLAAVLFEHELSAPRMAAVTVAGYERSPSYAEARDRLELLMKIPKAAWDRGMADRVRTAGENNSQLADAYFGSTTVARKAASMLTEIGF
jgi:hypothetical protein